MNMMMKFNVHLSLLAKRLNEVGFEVLAALAVKSTLFWDMMQCSPFEVL
jgi:hypothetical protein